MKHYVVIPFDTKEAAEKFAFEQKDVQVEVKSAEELDHKHMYGDVMLVMKEYMNLTEEEISKVDVAAIVDDLFDYDYSHYNDFIESKINEQFEEVTV